MSAYICDPKTHKALAVFATTRPRQSYRSQWRVDPRYQHKLKMLRLSEDHHEVLELMSREELATVYANVLYQENIRSVGARYPQDTFETMPGPIEKDEYLTVKYEDFKTYDPATIFKIADCLEYQSCETQDWEDTAAYELLSAIRKAAWQALPGYEDAPWGY